MTTNYKRAARNFPHGIMFHHFHGGNHPKVTGSLHAAQFAAMVDWAAERYNLLHADEFKYRSISGTLSEKDICLTFDDALKCQYDIIQPVLVERGIRAFFFVHSSPLTGETHYLELFRLFRETSYDKLDQFHEQFFGRVTAIVGDLSAHRKSFEKCAYLAEYTFYSEEERWFRYIRDRVIDEETYRLVMLSLIQERGFLNQNFGNRLYMSALEVTELGAFGHVIGLHSHSHPTAIAGLSAAEQQWQYEENLRQLEAILGAGTIDTMSHPCGSYSSDTLAILHKLGVRIGFCSAVSSGAMQSLLEIPREDHVNLLQEMLT